MQGMLVTTLHGLIHRGPIVYCLRLKLLRFLVSLSLSFRLLVSVLTHFLCISSPNEKSIILLLDICHDTYWIEFNFEIFFSNFVKTE